MCGDGTGRAGPLRSAPRVVLRHGSIRAADDPAGNSSRRAFAVYTIAYAGVFIVLIQIVNLVVFYGVSPRALLSRDAIAHVTGQLWSATGTDRPDMATLSALDRYPRLACRSRPSEILPSKLTCCRAGNCSPSYISVVGVYTEAALERKLQDVGKQEYLLLPRGFESGDPCAEYLKACENGFSIRLSSLVRPIRLIPAPLSTRLLPNTMFPSSGLAPGWFYTVSARPPLRRPHLTRQRYPADTAVHLEHWRSNGSALDAPCGPRGVQAAPIDGQFDLKAQAARSPFMSNQVPAAAASAELSGGWSIVGRLCAPRRLPARPSRHPNPAGLNTALWAPAFTARSNCAGTPVSITSWEHPLPRARDIACSTSPARSAPSSILP